MQRVSSLVFAVASISLALLSLALIGLGAHDMIKAFTLPDGKMKDAVLSAVGYVIIAIAVFDVAKFLIEEEVFNGRERRIASEARRSLTKFISTIAIAIFLEALVIVFRVSAEHVEQIVYPTMLLVAGTFLILGLGIFQRLSASVEHEVGEQDREDENGLPPQGVPPAR
ncbi:GNAT family acetyltransferase [Salinarimonas soli]|uniref:GNAT family acetyltransferase n=1 Tax=Salinarimonas soli TaxID=1638099 RepID=UPI001AEF07E8|nr:GNAT family acetyltransferase [Salinarimonas soli]